MKSSDCFSLQSETFFLRYKTNRKLLKLKLKKQLQRLAKLQANSAAKAGAPFPPPPVPGLGAMGGFKLQIEDRAGNGFQALDDTVKAFLAGAQQAPELVGLFTGYGIDVPQLFADVDRARARQLDVPITEIFNTLQIYLGSLYVNDFNQFGRTYSVRVQADAPYRARAEDIGALKVRSNTGEMIPLSALMNVELVSGPDVVANVRYKQETEPKFPDANNRDFIFAVKQARSALIKSFAAEVKAAVSP